MILYATTVLVKYLSKEISPNDAKRIIHKLSIDEVILLAQELDLAYAETGDETTRRMKSALRRLRIKCRDI